jgi:hypothetical protein
MSCRWLIGIGEKHGQPYNTGLDSTMFHQNIDTVFVCTKSESQQQLAGGFRSTVSTGGLQRILDSFDGANCLFLRTDTTTPFRLGGNYALLRSHAGGWLLHSRDAAAPSYWIPTPPKLRCIGSQGHISHERVAELGSFDLDTTGLAITFESIPEDWLLDAVIWKIDDPSLIGELQTLVSIETQGFFLLGSHTRYGKPADLYRHLVQGWVYEDRYAWPHKRRICSENDAHGLYLIFSGLERATGKRLYGLLKRQLLLSVLSRQGNDGAWRHGEWTDNMESHFRLHASAMHLLMDAHDEAPDPVIRQSLDRAAAFLAAQRERIQFGEWFLHDELELSEAGMAKAPFKWVASRALGKSPGNMLVLNSHLDTTVGLSRYNDLAHDDHLEQVLVSARACTLQMLKQRPAEWLYRMLMAAISPTFLPASEAARLPLAQRALKRLGWEYLIPLLPRIKARFPRLVMPGGYVDRELTLQTWAHHYLGINLMDLARHQRRHPEADIESLMQQIVVFGRNSGILHRWAELKYEKYALGFWAEALYHLCLLYPDRQDCRAALAEAMLLLEDTRQGQPPSLLGANAEAVPVAQQVPCPNPTDGRLRVANLSAGERIELLVVNPADASIDLAWQGHVTANLVWRDQQGRPAAGSVPPSGWLHGTSTGATH